MPSVVAMLLDIAWFDAAGVILSDRSLSGWQPYRPFRGGRVGRRFHLVAGIVRCGDRVVLSRSRVATWYFFLSGWRLVSWFSLPAVKNAIVSVIAHRHRFTGKGDVSFLSERHGWDVGILFHG